MIPNVKIVHTSSLNVSKGDAKGDIINLNNLNLHNVLRHAHRIPHYQSEYVSYKPNFLCHNFAQKQMASFYEKNCNARHV